MHFAIQIGAVSTIVMDFEPGGDFFTLLRKYSLTTSQAVFYSSQLLLALEHIPRNKIVLRDIKPENIFIDSTFNLKIGDFGYVRFFDKKDLSPKFRTACGTRQYLAPEIIRYCGKRVYDGKKADMWFVGCVSFILVFGHPPVNFASVKDPFFHC